MWRCPPPHLQPSPPAWGEWCSPLRTSCWACCWGCSSTLVRPPPSRVLRRCQSTELAELSGPRALGRVSIGHYNPGGGVPDARSPFFFLVPCFVWISSGTHWAKKLMAGAPLKLRAHNTRGGVPASGFFDFWRIPDFSLTIKCSSLEFLTFFFPSERHLYIQECAKSKKNGMG